MLLVRYGPGRAPSIYQRKYHDLLALDIVPSAPSQGPSGIVISSSYDHTLKLSFSDGTTKYLCMPGKNMFGISAGLVDDTVQITGDERVALSIGDTLVDSSARGYVLYNNGEGNFFISRIGAPWQQFVLNISRDGFVYSNRSRGFGWASIRFQSMAATKRKRSRPNPAINWNKVQRHWTNLQKTLHTLKLAAQLGILDTKIGDSLTRGEEGLPRRRVFDTGEFDLGHGYLPEDEAKIQQLDNVIDLAQSLGGAGGGMDEDDIDLASSNLLIMSNFINKTQVGWKEYLTQVSADANSEEGLLFDCLSSYIDATQGILTRSKRLQIRNLARSLSADRDALVDTLGLSPDREAAGFDWWPPKNIEQLFIDY